MAVNWNTYSPSNFRIDDQLGQSMAQFGEIMATKRKEKEEKERNARVAEALAKAMPNEDPEVLKATIKELGAEQGMKVIGGIQQQRAYEEQAKIAQEARKMTAETERIKQVEAMMRTAAIAAEMQRQGNPRSGPKPQTYQSPSGDSYTYHGNQIMRDQGLPAAPVQTEKEKLDLENKRLDNERLRKGLEEKEPVNLTEQIKRKIAAGDQLGALADYKKATGDSLATVDSMMEDLGASGSLDAPDMGGEWKTLPNGFKIKVK